MKLIFASGVEGVAMHFFGGRSNVVAIAYHDLNGVVAEHHLNHDFLVAFAFLHVVATETADPD